MCKHILINQFNPKTDFDILTQFNAKTFDNDGFGAIIRTDRNKIETFKSLDKGDFYIRLIRRAMAGDIRSLVVHHRTSTNELGIDYAHPFEFRGNWLTHNGVVNVPDKHDTATTNDSEALLHHLIKSDFDTKSISGYFSCFILNPESTTVLVDAIAPMYGDGRVFSSHKLSDNAALIQCKRITMSIDGVVLSESDIEVSESRYGLDKAHLSLGYQWHSGDMFDYSTGSENDEKFAYDDSRVFDGFYLTKSARELLSYITEGEEEFLVYARSKREFREYCRELEYSTGVSLSNKDIESLYRFYETDYPIMREYA